MKNRDQRASRSALRIGIVSFHLFVLVGSVLGQDWFELFPTGVPPARRALTQYAYDETSDRLILFGGDVNPPHAHPPDVWVLVNASGTSGTPEWVQLSPSGTLSGRPAGSLVYDRITNRIVLHGGCGEPFGLNHCSPGFKDAWFLTNANGLGGLPTWFPLPDSNVHPSLGREFHTAVSDTGSNRMIVFGGTLPFHGFDRNDVEVLGDANGVGAPSWSSLAPVGSLPPPRQSTTAVYDESSNRMIVFGGHKSAPWAMFDDTWVLSDANGVGTPQWTQLSPSGGPPPGRAGHTAGYDPSSNRMIVFGGGAFDSAGNFVAFYNDVWVLTNANGIGGTPVWTELLPGGALPLERYAHAGAYSPSRNRLIVTTGHNRFALPVPPQELNDVWVLTDANGMPTISDTSPATVWVGLKNSDDQGTRFDLRAELFINDTPVAEGVTRCIAGVTRNPAKAKEVPIAFGSISGGGLVSDDVLSFKVSTRIGTNPDDSKCPGHNNAVGLRLYYDAVSRPSRFGVAITPDPLTDLYLHSTSSDFFLDDTSPTSTQAKQKDSGPVNFAAGNPWVEIGAWSREIP